MNIATMSSWFDILQDKNGSAYFTPTEKSLFLNRAQIEFVDELFQGDGEQTRNIEDSQDTISKVAPLIVELPYLTMNSSGAVSKSSITTALTNIIPGAIVWRPLAIGLELGKIRTPISYVRHNDRWEFETNYFKRATTTNPKVRETFTSYVISPVSLSAKIYFTILKYPLEVDITNAISCELPDHTHDRITAIALEFAGLGSRDTLMTQLLQSQNK